MDRPRVSARRSMQPGKASKYIRSIEAIQPGDKVVLWLRVSTHWQEDNLDDQEANLRRVAEKRGATVVDVVRHTGSSCAGERAREDLLDRLADAAELARQHGAKLLAESTNRLVRPTWFDSKLPKAQATELDLRDLRHATEGVVLVTHLDPDATPGQEREYHTKRGQREKGRKGGRPAQPKAGHKKRRREEWLPYVVGWLEDGWTLGQIAKATGLPRATVQDWKAKYA